MSTTPTIVLVHGAFGDSGMWKGVIAKLQGQGYTTMAVANPLRGLETDAAYAATVAKSVEGPVVLVGHSYAGSVITRAARELVLFLSVSNGVSNWVAHLGIRRTWGRPSSDPVLRPRCT
ncbi:alpha/beta fold hydrolase [Streptomyces scabiei]|uniref:alpha/beta fold hydrolase n=1 Tax=Streptomyces scabiei TaxID=1930 RepID=UPI000765D5A5